MSNRRDDDRRGGWRGDDPATPIRDATPSQSTVQKVAEREAGLRPSAPTEREDRFAGHNRSADGTPSSISSMGEQKIGGPNHAGADIKPDAVPDKKPDADPVKAGPKTGRSHARGSTLGLKKEGRPAGQTKQDAPAPKKQEPRKAQRDAPKARKDARPAGQTKQDAPSVKREVVCKAPPTGKETRPKGGGGSGKRFVPYIGSKACK